MKEKIILNACTLKLREAERFYTTENRDEFFSSINDQISVVNEMNNVKLLIRFHPGFFLTKSEIKSLLIPSNNIIINLQGSFESVLKKADVLISYSSTAIEESLINFIPVILYDKWKRYNHLNAPSIKSFENSCVYYTTNKEELKNSLYKLLYSKENIQKETYYNYIYKNNYNNIFYDFVSNILQK